MSARIAFLLGTVTGFFAGLILAGLGTVLLVRTLLPEMTLDSLTTYRGAIELAQKSEEEKQPLLRAIDAISERVRGRGIGFLDSSEMTEALDPLVVDCRLSQEEWEQMSAGIQKAQKALDSD